jgi:threonine dehydratase
MDYFQLDVVGAERRIRPFVLEPLLQTSQFLASSDCCDVRLKLENLQSTRSFKLRGAANKLLSLTAVQAERGIVTASNGNHALAVATITRQLHIPVDVYVSESVDESRLRRIADCGAKVQRVAGDCLQAELIARRDAKGSGRVFVSPYNDSEVIAG